MGSRSAVATAVRSRMSMANLRRASAVTSGSPRAPKLRNQAMAQQCGFRFFARSRLPSQTVKRGLEQIARIISKPLPKRRIRVLIVNESQTFDDTVPDGQFGLIGQASGEFEIGSRSVEPGQYHRPGVRHQADPVSRPQAGERPPPALSDFARRSELDNSRHRRNWP